MKYSFFILLSVLSSQTGSAQFITWSPDLVSPRQKNLFTGLSFAGTDAANYYVSEFDGGGVSFNRKLSTYFHSVDKNSLKKVKEIKLDNETGGNDYSGAGNFLMNNVQYHFFLGEGAKDIYQISGSASNLDGTASVPFSALQKVDGSKSKPFASGASPLANKVDKRYGAMLAMSQFEIQPAYDRKSIVSAFIYETVDKGNSMLNVTEWDVQLKTVSSNNYKIPFGAKQRTQKTIFGALGTSDGDFPHVLDIAKGNDGFIYVMIESPNPKNEEEAGLYWLYQFKPTDPAYTKVFKKEINRNMSSAQGSLFQDESGKIFIATVGKEIESDKDKDETEFTNAAFIGNINNGTLETIFAGTFAPEMMHNFASEKSVDKKGAVSKLKIRDILPAANGSQYVIWEHNYKDENIKNDGSFSTTDLLGNVLVQYYTGKKLIWQKPIYKTQAQKGGRIQDIYAGVAAIVINGKLNIIYADDPKNSAKDIADTKVATFSVIKFGSKDLAGMFVASFDEKGNYTRKYINWPENRVGYALCMNSLKKVAANEYIGTVRKISQGAITLKSEEFSFFKFAL